MHAAHRRKCCRCRPAGMLTSTSMGKMDHSAMGHGAMKHDDPNSVLVEPGELAELSVDIHQGHRPGVAPVTCRAFQAGMVGKLTVRKAFLKGRGQRLVDWRGLFAEVSAMHPAAEHSPLGKSSEYISTYTPSLLFPIPRAAKWAELGLSAETLPSRAWISGTASNCPGCCRRQAGGGHWWVQPSRPTRRRRRVQVVQAVPQLAEPAALWDRRSRRPGLTWAGRQASDGASRCLAEIKPRV